MKPESRRLAALSAVIGQDMSAIRRMDAERLHDLVLAWGDHRDGVLGALAAFGDYLMTQVRKES